MIGEHGPSQTCSSPQSAGTVERLSVRRAHAPDGHGGGVFAMATGGEYCEGGSGEGGVDVQAWRARAVAVAACQAANRRYGTSGV